MNGNRADVQERIEAQASRSVQQMDALNSGEVKYISPDGSTSFVLKNGLIELRVGRNVIRITEDSGNLK